MKKANDDAKRVKEEYAEKKMVLELWELVQIGQKF